MKIAISGSYSTGKSTFSYALAHLLGLAHTEAKTMRELLPKQYPGKMLEECRWHELAVLSLLRYRERIRNEAIHGDPGYVSDGCALHEWAYGWGRLAFGIRPGKNKLVALIRYKLRLYKIGWTFSFLRSFEEVARTHTQTEYDVIVHLPIEFPLVKDGHRPVSEGFRRFTDSLLKSRAEQSGCRIIHVSGSLESRLESVVNQLSLEPVMTISDAVEAAKRSMQNNQFRLEELKRRKDVDWEKAAKAL